MSSVHQNEWYRFRVWLWRLFKKPQTLTALIAVSISIFLIWSVLTLLPVAIVETTYQVRLLATKLFGTTQLTKLFVPDFSGLNFEGRSIHREYGIVIPAIFLDEPVIFNVDPNDEKAYTAALKQGIAHASGTAFPDTAGLGYYFAHSSSPQFRTQYNAVFYLLGKLKIGDDIYIWHDRERFQYQVTSTKITTATDVNFLQQMPENEQIVLQTCWPPGTTNQRLLVFANRVANNPEK